MPMYNLTEYSNNYKKTFGSLRILKIWEYCKYIPAVNDNGGINKNGDTVDFNGDNATDSFNSKAKITSQADDDGDIDHA